MTVGVSSSTLTVTPANNGAGSGVVTVAHGTNLGYYSFGIVSPPSPTPTPIPSPTPTSALNLIPYSSCLTPACANTGPRVAVGPQPNITCPPSSINISATTTAGAVQATVTSAPVPSNFCFGSGTFQNQEVVPRQGDRYFGQGSTTIFDGSTLTPPAGGGTYTFESGATGVEVANLVVENYPVDTTAGHYINFGPTQGTEGWYIHNVETKNNGAIGISCQGDSGDGAGGRCIANLIHGNAEQGYTGIGQNIVFTDNILYANGTNSTQYPCTDQCGGGKFAKTLNAYIAYNYSYSNIGSGLWTDIDNVGVSYLNNDVENNQQGGITHEISWYGTFKFNYLSQDADNGTVCGLYLAACPELDIKSSGGAPGTGTTINVQYNYVAPKINNIGIRLSSDNRGTSTSSPPYYNGWGRWLPQNVQINHNVVVMPTGNTQICCGPAVAIDYAYGGTGSDAGMFTSQNNLFDFDTYYNLNGTNTTPWAWGYANNGNFVNFAGFQAEGQEIHGSATTATAPPVPTPYPTGSPTASPLPSVSPGTVVFPGPSATPTTFAVRETGYTGAFTASPTPTSVVSASVTGNGSNGVLTVTPVGPGTGSVSVRSTWGIGSSVSVTVNGPLSVSPGSAAFSGPTAAPTTASITDPNFSGTWAVSGIQPLSVVSASITGNTLTVTPINYGSAAISVTDGFQVFQFQATVAAPTNGISVVQTATCYGSTSPVTCSFATPTPGNKLDVVCAGNPTGAAITNWTTTQYNVDPTNNNSVVYSTVAGPSILPTSIAVPIVAGYDTGCEAVELSGTNKGVPTIIYSGDAAFNSATQTMQSVAAPYGAAAYVLGLFSPYLGTTAYTGSATVTDGFTVDAQATAASSSSNHSAFVWSHKIEGGGVFSTPSPYPTAPATNAIYVATTGNDTTGTGTFAAPYASIQRAEYAATTAGTFISVAPGTYTALGNSNYCGSSNVVLLVCNSGSSGNNTRIVSQVQGAAIISGGTNPSVGTNTPYCVDFNTNISYVTLTGFTIQNCATFGVLINAATNQFITINHNEIEHIAEWLDASCPLTGKVGVYVGVGNHDITVDSNDIHDVGRLPGSCGNSTDYTTDHLIYTHGVYNYTESNNTLWDAHSGWPSQFSGGQVTGMDAGYLIANNSVVPGPSPNPNALTNAQGDFTVYYPEGASDKTFVGTIENDIHYAPVTMLLNMGSTFDGGLNGGNWTFNNNIIGNASPLYGNGTCTSPTTCVTANNLLLTNPCLYGPTLPIPNFTLMSQSLAIGAGIHDTNISQYDYQGLPRPNPPSIGALELGAGYSAESAIFNTLGIATSPQTYVGLVEAVAGGVQPTSPPAGPISASPTSIPFANNLATPAAVTVMDPYYSGTFTAVPSPAGIASASVNANSVAVAPLAVGTGIVTISDTAGNSTTVSVSVSPTPTPAITATPIAVYATPYTALAAVPTTGPASVTFPTPPAMTVVAQIKTGTAYTSAGDTAVSLPNSWYLEAGDFSYPTANPNGAQGTHFYSSAGQQSVPTASLATNTNYVLVGSDDGAHIIYTVCTYPGASCTAATSVTTTAIPYSSGAGLVGASSGTSPFTRLCNCDIWNVQIYNQALTAGNISALVAGSSMVADPYPSPLPTPLYAVATPYGGSNQSPLPVTFPTPTTMTIATTVSCNTTTTASNIAALLNSWSIAAGLCNGTSTPAPNPTGATQLNSYDYVANKAAVPTTGLVNQAATFIAATWNGTSQTLYVCPASASPAWTCNTPVVTTYAANLGPGTLPGYIGTTPGGTSTRQMNGDIWDFSMRPALTAAQVQVLAYQSRVDPYTAATPTPTPTTPPSVAGLPYVFAGTGMFSQAPSQNNPIGTPISQLSLGSPLSNNIVAAWWCGSSGASSGSCSGGPSVGYNGIEGANGPVYVYCSGQASCGGQSINANAPLLTITFLGSGNAYQGHPIHVPSWAVNQYGLLGVTNCANGASCDDHMIVADYSENLYFEGWQCSNNSYWSNDNSTPVLFAGQLHCNWGGGHVIGSNGIRNDGQDAVHGGYAIADVTITPQEITNAVNGVAPISHAMMMGTGCLNNPTVFPADQNANGTDYPCGYANAPSYGDLVVLKSTVTIPTAYSPECKVILKALQTYGAYLGDTGQSQTPQIQILTMPKLVYTANPTPTTNGWDPVVADMQTYGDVSYNSGLNDYSWSSCLQRLTWNDFNLYAITPGQYLN